MWRDAKFAEMISSDKNKDKKSIEIMKKKLAELEAKKNDKGEIVFDYDELNDE